MKKKNERGALIVEASIVFPVMFLVIFFMMYAGNAYLQSCRMESIINEYALEGAAYCADPQLKTAEAGKMPALDGLKVYPYRYFSSDKSGYGSNVAGQIEGEIYKKMTAVGTGLFPGMKPTINRNDIKATYVNGFIYATFAVDAKYKIRMPIRLLGETEHMYFYGSTHVEVPVSDSVEMIRNIDMVWDYMERFGVAEKLQEAKTKLSQALDKVNDWFDG